MPRKTADLFHQLHQLLAQTLFGIQSKLAKLLLPADDTMAAVQVFNKMLQLHFINPQRLPNITDRAFQAVADHRCRQRCPLAAIFLIQILNNFFAPTALNVNINVGGPVAFCRKKTLKQ